MRLVSNLYLNIISRILIDAIKLAPTNKGMFWVSDACAAQKALPDTDRTSMDMERSSVCFVCSALIICGTSISVHKLEAIQPNITSSVISSVTDSINVSNDCFHKACFSQVFFYLLHRLNIKQPYSATITRAKILQLILPDSCTDYLFWHSTRDNTAW